MAAETKTAKLMVAYLTKEKRKRKTDRLREGAFAVALVLYVLLQWHLLLRTHRG
jgi:hypothetical protein